MCGAHPLVCKLLHHIPTGRCSAELDGLCAAGMRGSLNLKSLLCKQARFFLKTTEGGVRPPPTRKGQHPLHPMPDPESQRTSPYLAAFR